MNERMRISNEAIQNNILAKVCVYACRISAAYGSTRQTKRPKHLHAIIS